MKFDFPADYYSTATINSLTAIDKWLPIFLSQLHRWLLKLKPFRLKLLTLLRKSYLIRSILVICVPHSTNHVNPCAA